MVIKKKKRKKKPAPVVAVLNMKGGVGKTTIAANVFKVMFARRRIKTLLLDLDPQYNLTQSLMTRSAYDQWQRNGKTILSVMEPPSELSMLQIATIDSPPPKAAEIVRALKYFKSSPSITLKLVAGDFRLVKYSLQSDGSKLTTVRTRFLKFVDAARREYQLVCIDCNPSSSFLTLCALHASTHLLVPVRPDRYSILGVEMLSDYIEQIPSLFPKPKMSILLNAVPRQGHDDAVEDELRAHSDFSSITLGNVLHYSEILAAKPDYTGFAVDKGVPHRRKLYSDVSAVADELAKAIGV